MRSLTRDDILDLDGYEAARELYRERLFAHKRARRLPLGDKVTLLFEDRETVRYQIQEMARVEGIRDPEKIQHEIDAYGELIPGPGELSATLFIEITDLSRVKPELDRLLGIDESVSIVIGELEDERRVRGLFDERQLDDDRISAVHYVRFRLAADEREAFASAERLRVRIDHPHYREEAEIGPATRESLLRDLRGETHSLLDAASAPAARASEVLLETERVRVHRPARAVTAEHVIVEPRDASTSLLDADPELLAELIALVQRFAREISERTGSCRVTTRVAPEGSAAGGGLQWHLVADPS